MTLLKLYRGITVPPEEVDDIRAEIIENGLRAEHPKMSWNFRTSDLRSRLDVLLGKRDLSTSDTRRSGAEEFPMICACGDQEGAIYYATKHNVNPSERKTRGMVIEFEAPLPDLHVDGRDFLYNSVFRDAKSEMQREMACRLFGQAVARYLDRAMEAQDSGYKFAMCDLAVQDLDVVIAHYENPMVIGGRYGTLFRSAFFVKAPVPASRVISVRKVDPQESLSADVTLDSFRAMGE